MNYKILLFGFIGLQCKDGEKNINIFECRENESEYNIGISKLDELINEDHGKNQVAKIEAFWKLYNEYEKELISSGKNRKKIKNKYCYKLKLLHEKYLKKKKN